MKKIKSILLSLLVAVSAISFSTGDITASAYSDGISTPHDILSDELFCKEVDYSLWDNFIRYDLCITDYDSLTDENKELCKFIFETERSAAYTVRCERARRIVDGEDVGERISLDDIIGAYGIWNKYAARKDGNFKYIQCVPDIVATDSPNIYNEYWFDDEGKYGVRFKGENGSFSDEYDDFVLCGDYTKEDYIELQNKYNDISNYDGEYCFKIDTLQMPTIMKYDDKASESYLDYTGYIEQDGNYYYITDENTAVLVGASVRTLDEPEAPCDQPFKIPSQVNGCDVVAIAEYAFDNSAVTEIILPDSLRFIEAYAFYNCRYLEKINFPKRLEYIGSMAFTDGADFSNLYIDCLELYIAPFAFYSMQNLEEAYINAKTIGEESFKQCLNLKKLELGNNVKRIEARAFYNCSSIENPVIPSNVEIIGAGAFAGSTAYGYSGVKSVTISAETEIIGAYAEELGSPDTSGISIDPVDPLTEEPVCVFDADCEIYGYANSEVERYADEFSLNFNNIQEPSATTTTLTTTSKPTTTTVTTITTPIVTTEKNNILGNVNGDDKLDVRDCAFIASVLASGKSDTLTKEADFNGDGKVNVRDAAAIAKFLAEK